MRVKLDKVCKRIYAGGDVPKDRYSTVKTAECAIPIYANAEKDNGLYGYTDTARENELSITVAARGTIGFTAIRREPFLPVVRLITVVPDLSTVSERYLYYALRNCKPASSGTSIPQLTVPDIKKNEIELYSLSVQETIADKLDAVGRVIELRQQQLQKLDELVKARFVELFGDPLKNEKCLPVVSGEALFKLSNGKALPNNKRFDTGVPAYGGNGISWYTDEILCDYDTIIVGRVGFQSGNVHLVKAPLWVTDNAMYISNINSRECDIRYLCALMEHIDFTRYQDAGDLKKITQKPFMQMHYLMPPLPLQKQYIAFVKQADKSKVAVQKALDEAQLLFDSLMQKYFG